MAGVFLHHGNQPGIVGIQTGVAFDDVVVTVQQDAAYVYSISTQRQQHFMLLGASHLEFATPVVFDSGLGSYLAALKNRRSQTNFLVTCTPSDSAPTPSLVNAAPQLPVDGEVFSMHTLQQPAWRQRAAVTNGSNAASHVAVVLKDGRVGLPNWDAFSFNPSPLLKPQLSGSATRATAHFSNLLCVITQPLTGQPATVCVFQLTPASSPTTSSKLSLTNTLALTPPSSNAAPVGCSCSTSHALCFWSDGSLSCLHMGPSQLLLGPQHASHNTNSSTLQYGLPGCAGSAGPVSNTGTGDEGAGLTPINGSMPHGKVASRSKKRKNTNAPNSGPASTPSATSCSHPVPPCTAVSDTQFVLLAPFAGGTPGSDGPRLLYAVVNAQFGCVQCCKDVQLDSLPASAAGVWGRAAGTLPLPRFSHHAQCLPGGTVVLLAAGHVLVVQLELPKTGLAALVGLRGGQSKRRGNTSTSGSNPQPASGQLSLLADGLSQGQHIVWESGSSDPPQSLLVGSLDMDRLMLDHLVSGVGDVLELTMPDEAEGVEVEEEEVNAQRLLERVASGGSTGVLEEACRFVLQCTQAGSGCAGALPYITAEGLARHGLWSDLERLVAGCPLTSLACASELVPSLLASQQFDILAALLRSATDLTHVVLAEVLRHYTTNSSSWRDARARYHAAMVAAAEKEVAAAEKDPQKPNLRKQARCAAAVVSGFTPQQAVLHALVACPLDPSVLALAMAGLSCTQMVMLLRYLGKWTQKYEQQLPDGVEDVNLPPSLVFPAFPQVLDWLLALLDMHMTQLSWHSDSHELLSATRDAVSIYVKTSQSLIPLSGVIDHWKAGAQLPRFNMVPPSMYTVELLNLRVGAYSSASESGQAGNAGMK